MQPGTFGLTYIWVGIKVSFSLIHHDITEPTILFTQKLTKYIEPHKQNI